MNKLFNFYVHYQKNWKNQSRLEIKPSWYNIFISGMEKNYKFKYESSKKALESINRYNYYI